MYQTVGEYGCPNCGTTELAIVGDPDDLHAECHGCGRVPHEDYVAQALGSL